MANRKQPPNDPKDPKPPSASYSETAKTHTRRKGALGTQGDPRATLERRSATNGGTYPAQSRTIVCASSWAIKSLKQRSGRNGRRATNSTPGATTC
jgi:hypothetical protein